MEALRLNFEAALNYWGRESRGIIVRITELVTPKVGESDLPQSA
jgi:hypothetical protein